MIKELKTINDGDIINISLVKDRMYTNCKVLENDKDDKQLDVVVNKKNFIINYAEVITFKKIK